MYNKIVSIYFSATDNTRKSVNAMAECFDGEKQIIDITDNKEYSETNIDKNTFVIFGAPVYAGRLPYIAKERFAKFKGNNTPCTLVLTYGNRHYDDALKEFYDMATEQGFVVMGCATLVCKHTYGQIQTERPDEKDLSQDKEFIKAVLNKKQATDLHINVNDITKPVMTKGHFLPHTDNNCIKCGLCVRKCPMGAIAKDCVSIENNCMSCLRCVKICPKKAKNVQYDEYIKFAEEFTQKLKNRRENEYFI